MLIWSVLWCGLDGRNGYLLLGLVSPGSWLLLFFGSRGRDKEKMWPGLLERAAECLTLGCLFKFSSLPRVRAAGVLGSAHTPELLGQFVLGSHCPFIKLVYSACLEPWLIVFTARLCSLLTLSSVTAVPSTWVHAAQEERVCLETWGHIRALCFLTSFRHRSLSPLCLLSHDEG